MSRPVTSPLAKEPPAITAVVDAELDDVRWLLGHRNGRRHLWRLLWRSGLFTPTGELRSHFDPNPRTDAHTAGNKVLAIAMHNLAWRASPQLYLQMWEENSTRE